MKMKVPVKPLSSPGRTIDEFPVPPPLMMRFPRSKSSRGSRSRSNPMFLRKINTINDVTQEPTSPKVTCIGQVRVNRSKNKQSTKTAGSTTGGLRCCKELKPMWLRRAWKKNLSFFRCGRCRESENLHESKRIETNQRNSEYWKRGIGDVNRVIEGENEVLNSESSSSPPRNALLLTRSRSAPYRSEYFASKFWESTMVETSEIEKREDDEKETVNEVVENMEVNEGEGESEGVIEKENGEEEKEEGFINGDEEEFEAKTVNLSRCNSESARTGEK